MLKQRKSDLLSPESPFVLSSEMISRRIKIKLQRPIRPYEPMDLINGCILSAEINPKSTKSFTVDRVVQRGMFTGVVSRSPGRATTKKESKMRSFDKRRQKSCYTKGGSLHSQTKYILERSIFRKNDLNVVLYRNSEPSREIIRMFCKITRGDSGERRHKFLSYESVLMIPTSRGPFQRPLGDVYIAFHTVKVH